MNETEREFRTWLPPIEIRAATGGKGLGTIVGLLVPYERLSDDMGGWFERFKRGAFKECLARADEIVSLRDHDMARLLGRRSAGTARFTDTDEGVMMECDVPDVTYARDMMVSLERKDLKGMSCGFWHTTADWTDLPDGKVIRVITKADLFDGSVVTWPAYPDTSIAVRSRPVKPSIILDPRDQHRSLLARQRAPRYAAHQPQAAK